VAWTGRRPTVSYLQKPSLKKSTEMIASYLILSLSMNLSVTLSVACCSTSTAND
jgi:hypothetical protein